MDFNDNDTLTGVCNSALAAVGHTDFIDDIESENTVAQTLRVLVKQVCREVQAHENSQWQELEREVSLVKKSDEADGHSLWNLPFHMISPVSCYKVVDKRREEIPYEITGGILRTREREGVCLRCMLFSFEPESWSTELKTCVIKLLSVRVLAALLKDYSASQQMERQFWQFDFPLWVGNSRNKFRRDDYRGSDSLLTQFY